MDIFNNTEMEYKLAKRIFLDNLSKSLYFPKYFEIETVRACNARCVMCTINKWDNKKTPIMKNTLFDKFVKEISNYSEWIEIVTLNKDGEPTLDKNLSYKIKALKDIGIKKVRFTTNVERLDEKFATDVLTAGIDEVMFSVDSINKNTYESIRIGLDFNKVIKNINSYINLRNKINPKSKITIRMIEMKETIGEKNEWLKYWNDKILSHDDAYVMPMHNWGNQLEENYKDKVDYYASKPCISPFSSFIIHSDGKIGMCAIDFNSKYLMGNFNENTIVDIWQNDKFNTLRKNHLNRNRNKYTICKGCDIWDRSYEYGK